MQDDLPSITVVVPTFKRPQSLRRCLVSLKTQNLLAEEILTVVREHDIESLNLAKELEVKFLIVDSPGIVFAIQSALKLITTELVAFIDDDVSLPPDWVIKAKCSFVRHPDIGALGGTDLQANIQLRDNVTVGKFTCYGKLIGNHHLASGSKLYVDFLKGCNMVLRTSVAQNYSPIFTLLRGNGAQVGNDLVFSLSSRLQGYRTLFDPDFFVYHHVAPRKDSSQRNALNEMETLDSIYNLFLIKLTFSMRFTRYAVFTYQLLIGDREVPGLVRSLSLRKLQINLVILDIKNILSIASKVFILSSANRRPLTANKLGKH